MNLIEEAESLYSQNKFKEALSIFENIISGELEFSEIDYENSYKRVIQIYKFLNDFESFYMTTLSLSDFYIRNKKFNESLKVLEDINENLIHHDESYFYNLAYISAKNSGNLSKAKSYSTRYLEYQLDKKNIPLAQKHLFDRKEAGLEDEVSLFYDFKLNLLKGEIEFFEQYFEEIFLEYKNTKNSKLSIMSQLYYLVEGDNHWRLSKTWLAFKIIEQLKNIKMKRDIKARKKIAHAIYDLILIDPKSFITYELLLDVGLNVKRSEMTRSAVKALAALGIKKLGIEDVIEELGEDPTTQLDTEMDLGTDLFQDFGSENELEALEKKIEFLRSTGETEQLSGLLAELREIDSNHTLVKELIEKEQKDLGSRLISTPKKSIDIKTIEEELLLELSQFISHDEEEGRSELESNERAFKKVISLMPIDTLFENSIDLISVFNTLGMPGVSLLILEYLNNEESEKSDVKSELNLKYLLIETYLEANRFYKALNIAEEVCEKYPLIDEEKKCFYYLRAEILRKLGNVREALKYYAYVAKIDQSYRLVRQRLNEFE